VNPLERIRAAATGREVEVLCATERLAWGRTVDLVIGSVDVTPEGRREEVDAAYDALENENVLREHELWNVVLIVFVSGEPLAAAQCARGIERDLTRSRKLAVLPGQALPQLFAAFDLSTASAHPPADPLALALDRVCSPHERTAMNALLRERRNSADVERLLQILGSDSP
jgi:hypothetical protein